MQYRWIKTRNLHTHMHVCTVFIQMYDIYINTNMFLHAHTLKWSNKSCVTEYGAPMTTSDTYWQCDTGCLMITAHNKNTFSARTLKTRSWRFIIGWFSPLYLLTSYMQTHVQWRTILHTMVAILTISVKRPTTRKSPCSLAFSRKSTWPICRAVS